jgi:hypothetical protein
MNKEAVILGLLIFVGSSITIGLIWSIFYLLYNRNLQTSFKLFLFSFLVGVLNAIVGLLIGYFVGILAAAKVPGSLFGGGKAFILFLWIVFFGFIGSVEGAILGGLIFIRIYL